MNNNNEGFLTAVIKLIEDYQTRVDLQYQSFLLDNYPELLIQNRANLRVPHEVKAYAIDNKVFYWVIDECDGSLEIYSADYRKQTNFEKTRRACLEPCMHQ